MKKVAVSFIILLFLLILAEQIFFNKKELANTEEDLYGSGLMVGEKAPEFSLEQLDGSPLSLKDLKGKKVLVNFWASWCEPCIKEMPDIQKVYDEYKEDGNIEILAINLTIGKETPEKARAFVEEMGLTFPVLLDVGGEIQKLYQVIPIPTSFFIDEDGVIRSVHQGPMTEEYIKKEFNRL